MPNRLADATSPYLRQHQDNPVDWYPWGDEAFERARREDKPIFLSVGYSSCHWCHVMAHESFESAEVASVLNEYFVPVKLDREERPDVDEAYMAAVQLTSGRGGWPMSVFLTPDRKPFFAGTYFPKDDRSGYPGFITICRQIAVAWTHRREDLEKAAEEISGAVRQSLSQPGPEGSVAFDQAFVDGAVRQILSDFDAEHGGFGQAPKFPPHTCIDFLLDYATRTPGPSELREAALGASLVTLQRMAYGGIHDHVGGGFHRYSTDGRWLLPHFEKMLYDNALCLSNYARASVLAEGFSPDIAERFRTTAAGIVDWTMREMTSEEGVFYSALDADSEGEEGKFYVWTEAEVRQVLGQHADVFLAAFNFTPEGNFRDEATGHASGTNIPHLSDEPTRDFEPHLEALRQAREARIRPGLDDKALTSWNGLMIGALAEVGLLAVAGRAAEVFLRVEAGLGHLPQQISPGQGAGRASGEAFLDGYAYLADALFRLAAIAEAFEQEGEPVEMPRSAADYRAQAERLGREMVERFYDPEAGGFFSSGDRHEVLFGRSKPAFDQPQPSGNAVALRVLLEMGDEVRARQTLSAMLGWMERVPSATEALFEAALPLMEMGQGAAPEATPEAEPAPPIEKPKPLTVGARLSPAEIEAGSDGYGSVEVVLSIPEGLHVNSNQPPARWLTATAVEVNPVKSEVSYPSAAGDRYEGEVRIPIRLQLPPGESGADFEVRVTYQACTESECQLPETKTFGGVIYR
jgi:uncharacterized protein YyaL (SSP411 family)